MHLTYLHTYMRISIHAIDIIILFLTKESRGGLPQATVLNLLRHLTSKQPMSPEAGELYWT